MGFKGFTEFRYGARGPKPGRPVQEKLPPEPIVPVATERDKNASSRARGLIDRGDTATNSLDEVVGVKKKKRKLESAVRDYDEARGLLSTVTCAPMQTPLLEELTMRYIDLFEDGHLSDLGKARHTTEVSLNDYTKLRLQRHIASIATEHAGGGRARPGRKKNGIA
ncbi:MAG: hypothetical protein AAB573_03545 [Patescibacteria group bacterium]